MQTTQQLHTKVVLCLPEVLMGGWWALGAYSRVLDSIRCTLRRKSPTHPCLLRFGLHHSAVSAHKTKLEDILQEHKLQGTNGRSVHGTRLDLVWSEEPRDGMSSPPRATHRLLSWMFSKPGFGWYYCGCFQAPASLDLLFTSHGAPEYLYSPGLLMIIN